MINKASNRMIDPEKNNMVFTKVPAKHWGVLDQSLVPYMSRKVEKGVVYEIALGKHKERCFFECVKSGKVLIKYRFNNHTKKDMILIKGVGQLKPRPDLTEGVNYG